jgi:hypothetical protein
MAHFDEDSLCVSLFTKLRRAILQLRFSVRGVFRTAVSFFTDEAYYVYEEYSLEDIRAGSAATLAIRPFPIFFSTL